MRNSLIIWGSISAVDLSNMIAILRAWNSGRMRGSAERIAQKRNDRYINGRRVYSIYSEVNSLSQMGRGECIVWLRTSPFINLHCASGRYNGRVVFFFPFLCRASHIGRQKAPFLLQLVFQFRRGYCLVNFHLLNTCRTFFRPVALGLSSSSRGSHLHERQPA